MVILYGEILIMSELQVKTLEKLLQDFYTLTGIKTCLYDMEGNELCFYPNKFSRFCEILRTNEQMDQKCKDCDKLAFAHCKKTHSQYIYTCHAGLQECISPIVYENQVIGFIMLGQIKKSGAPNFVSISRNLPADLIDPLRISYDSLPVISPDKLTSAFRILDACAGYELLKKFVQSHNNAIDAQIEQYVRDNISHPISVTQLCKRFHLSHCEIYQIFKEYFSCTPAEYIKKSRLKHACKLLTTTEYPVNKIAILCGIPDYNYFSKTFKANFGISPTVYRKSNRAKTV